MFCFSSRISYGLGLGLSVHMIHVKDPKKQLKEKIFSPCSVHLVIENAHNLIPRCFYVEYIEKQWKWVQLETDKIVQLVPHT